MNEDIEVEIEAKLKVWLPTHRAKIDQFLDLLCETGLPMQVSVTTAPTAAIKSDEAFLQKDNDEDDEEIAPELYQTAWKSCSWDVVAVGYALTKLADGIGPKGEYTLMNTLTSEQALHLCGELNERSVSSRVGRTQVICKKLGKFRLMEIGVRKRDKAKRVYINSISKQALLDLLRTDWKSGFIEYLNDNKLAPLTLD